MSEKYVLIPHIEEVCLELRRRVDRNQPMDTEQLLGMLLVIAETVREMKNTGAGTATPDKPGESHASGAPKEGQTVTRHL